MSSKSSLISFPAFVLYIMFKKFFYVTLVLNPFSCNFFLYFYVFIFLFGSLSPLQFILVREPTGGIYFIFPSGEPIVSTPVTE